MKNMATRKRAAVALRYDVVDRDYSTVESYLRHAFKNRASLYASDVADALGLEYATVREIIARMIKEGKLTAK
jgi:predicted ArsR family transcriptional regulator